MCRSLVRPALLVLCAACLTACAPPVVTPPAQGHAVRSEVILLGTEDGIEQVRSEVATQMGFELTVIPTQGVPDAVTGLPVSYICAGCGLQLFDLSSKNPGDVSLVVAIARRVRTTGSQHVVYATPNYPLLLSDSGVPITGQPWYIGGSPWYIGGSPYSGQQQATAAQPARSAFVQQWAFQSPAPPAGIGLNIESLPPPSAVDVAAFVFDTASLPTGGAYSLDPATDTGTLDVMASVGRPTAAPQPTASCVLAPHGLFVAGLLHAVAPRAPITLIPVLDECGRGELFGLLAAIDAARQALEGTLKRRAVLNFSLGVEADARTKEAFGVSGKKLETVCDTVAPDDPGLCRKEIEEEIAVIRTFEVLLSSMDQGGAVIVAAAGNGSADLPAPDVMQMPAAYSYAIGVSAGSQSGDRSCYSNEVKAADTWVRAPGGAGHPQPPSNCSPYFNNCDNQGGSNCPYGVISLLHEGPEFQYGYWVGSSFATPLVSGLAAQCLAEGQSWLPGAPDGEVAGRVWDAIRGAVGATKVIRVPETLERCRQGS